VVIMPRRGIGDATLHAVHDLCREERLSLGKAVAEVIKRGTAPARAAEGLRQFLGLVQHFRQAFQQRDRPLRALALELVDAIGYDREITRTSRNAEHAFNRRQNIKHVVEAIGDYEGRAERATLAGFLEESSLDSDGYASREERRKQGVTLMTVHSAKGLEFPFVFITGMEEGLLPHDRSLNEDGLEEERRLFYVALTRGRRHVTLFEALSRSRNGKARMSKTSRFLAEIPPALLEQRVMAARDMVEAKVAPPKPKAKPRRKPAKRTKD
jgi:DNA helicase-2/ATP-dependent DNA helicase PcrA